MQTEQRMATIRCNELYLDLSRYCSTGCWRTSNFWKATQAIRAGWCTCSL